MTHFAETTTWSLFSGIGGLDEGLRRAGWRTTLLCESDEYRRAVLAERFPGVPCYEDVRDVSVGEPTRGDSPDTVCEAADGRGRKTGSGLPSGPDLLCGGFPCQDLSVAGKRAGLRGERSGLFFEFARVAGDAQPRWLLLENVPGLLSSHGGRDFGVVLGTLADLGYGVAWRILNAQCFGVPQRRRRVFILGAFAGDDPRAAAERTGQVLAVGTSCGGHPPKGRAKAKEITGTLGGGAASGRGWCDDLDRCGALVTNALTTRQGRLDHNSETFVATTIDARYGQGMDVDATDTLVPTPRVRRLTPRECERLQGLPDDWTLIEWRGKPTPAGTPP